MSDLKVNFLGTGTSQGVPVIACKCEVCQSTDSKDKRLRSSIHIEVEGKSIVVDTGPDFRQQMLRAGIENLDAILYTHAHKDHIAGMDDIRAYNYAQKKDMEIYADQLVQEGLRKDFHYVFADFKYPGIPQVNLNTITKDAFDIDDLKVQPIEVFHYKLPVLGFRIKDFTYITDANRIEPKEIDKIRGSKVFVINALRREEHISHFTLGQALELIKEVKPEKAYLTHISHLLGKHEEVSKELPENVEIAYDGLVIEIN